MARLYKNMEIFQLGYALAIDLNKLVDKFPEKEKDNIISQIRRAATSIPINMAEGANKKSPREFLNFLSYSYGSCKELDVLLMMSRDLDYITKEGYDEYFQRLDTLMIKVFRFMKNIEGRFESKKRFFVKFPGEHKK